MSVLWHHLWPGWDALWPNLLASLIWATPALITHHVLTRKHLHRLEKLVCSSNPGPSPGVPEGAAEYVNAD